MTLINWWYRTWHRFNTTPMHTSTWEDVHRYAWWALGNGVDAINQEWLILSTHSEQARHQTISDNPRRVLELAKVRRRNGYTVTIYRRCKIISDWKETTE